MLQLVEIKFGSHLYGTSTPSSDTDYKAVHLPAAEDVRAGFGGDYRPVVASATKEDRTVRNGPDDVDRSSFALHRYLRTLCVGRPEQLDMLFAPEWAYVGPVHPLWEEVVANRSRLVSRRVEPFVRYTRQQASKYGIRGSRVAALRRVVGVVDACIARVGTRGKLRDEAEFVVAALADVPHVAVVPVRQVSGEELLHLECCEKMAPFTVPLKDVRAIYARLLDRYGHRALLAEKNEGVDWKAMSHAVRVGRQALELLQTGRVTFPRPEAAYLLDIKTGSLPFALVAGEVEGLVEAVQQAAEASRLPDEPDWDWVEALVSRAYSDHAGIDYKAELRV